MAFISNNQQTNNITLAVDPSLGTLFNDMPELQKYMNQIMDLYRSNIQSASREEQQRFARMNENERNIYLKEVAKKQISSLAIKIVQSSEEQRKVYRNAILNASKSTNGDKIMQEFIAVGEKRLSDKNPKAKEEAEQKELFKMTKADLLNPEKKALVLRGIEKYNESLPEKRREIIITSIFSLISILVLIVAADSISINLANYIAEIFFKISIVSGVLLQGVIHIYIPLIKAIKRLIKESRNIKRLELLLQELENSQNTNTLVEPVEENFEGGLGI